MPVLINNANEYLVFIHIPKTAGTSIKAAIRDDVRVMLNHEFKKELPCPPQHFHFELLERLGFVDCQTQSFAIVRHPIKRFLSEFAYRKKVDRKFPQMRLTSFALFVMKIYAYNPYILSNHIRPQKDFIGKTTKVFHIEDGLEHCIEQYPSFFKVKAGTSPRENRSNSSAISIDPRVLCKLKAFYKDDIEAFAYDTKDINVQKESTFSYMLANLQSYAMYIIYRLFK